MILSQRDIWEQEHLKPHVLPQMDKHDVSSGVEKFWEWLCERKISAMSGIEMCCGKGRNCIWLAEKGVIMSGFDFSPTAIKEAKARTSFPVNFVVHDATIEWPFPSNCFDIAIDCFASTDIDTFSGRLFARDELRRVLKKGGYMLLYTLSVDDEFQEEMIQKHPAQEKHSFRHFTGKFEKAFDHAELLDFCNDFTVVEDKRIEKYAEFYGKKYKCKHFWMILRK